MAAFAIRPEYMQDVEPAADEVNFWVQSGISLGSVQAKLLASQERWIQTQP